MNDPVEREEAVFEEALRLPASERAGYLDRSCGNDATLRHRVEALLAAFGRSAGFMKQPAAPNVPFRTLPAEKPGDRIGHYKLLEQIGEGGCGVVYVAEQEEPVRRRVALKVVKLGMDTKQVIARFDAERQALAMMDHPNIARIYEAGVTDAGRPYFVMELVRGVKITDFCEQHHLPPRERLGLFTKVCRAIQHAHQKGVIHRDIKPSNILVTSDDGDPVPKVIDFGIAKATQGRLTDQTVYTAFEQFIGTPAYMSPEQAQLSMQDIDTRSDIYSLGVLLYELLTGTTPFDSKELLSKGLDEMRRTIREVEPVKPSTRLTQTSNFEVKSAPRTPRSAIPSDLDWIVMKCLEKDRTRRYETANGLGTDISRHLSNEPIVARPPSKLYEFQKACRRHKFGFAATAAVIVTLAVGLAVSTRMYWEAQMQKERAQTEAAKSRQTATFLRDMIESVGPSVALGRDTKLLREILDQTAGRLDELTGQPEVKADMCQTLGVVYCDLAEYKSAEAMLTQSLDLRKKLHGDRDLRVAAVLDELGQLYHRAYQPEKAESAYLEALRIHEELLDNESLQLAGTLEDFGSLLRYMKKPKDAEPKLRKALALRRQLLPPEHVAIAGTLSSLGMALDGQGRFAEAEQCHRDALEMRKKLLPPQHPHIADSEEHLATTLASENKVVEAEERYLAAIAIQKKVLGDHRNTADTLDHFGGLLMKLNRLPEAEDRFREGMEVRNRVYGTSAAYSEKFIEVLKRQGKEAEADKFLAEKLAVQNARTTTNHPPLN